MRKRKAGERRERSGCEHPTCDYDAVNSHMTDDSMKSSLTYPSQVTLLTSSCLASSTFTRANDKSYTPPPHTDNYQRLDI